eukprot:3940457-Rhodomonas_salina.2
MSVPGDLAAAGQSGMALHSSDSYAHNLFLCMPIYALPIVLRLCYTALSTEYKAMGLPDTVACVPY